MVSSADDTDVDGDAGSGSDAASSLLYDVLVLKEWTPQTKTDEDDDDEEDESPADGQNDSLDPTAASPASSSSGWLASFLPLSRWTGLPVGGTSAPGGPFGQFVHLRQSCVEALPWILSSSSGGHFGHHEPGRLALLKRDSLELLLQQSPAATGPQALATLTEVPLPGPIPDPRQLVFSPDGSLLIVTANNGRVFVYDAAGQPIYSLLSQHLSPWNAPAEWSRAYVAVVVFAADVRVASRSREWNSEMILIDHAGRACSFLLSFSGYQELSTFSFAPLYPDGVTCVAWLPKAKLLLVSGPMSGGDDDGRQGISCWRLLTERPFYERVDLQTTNNQRPRRRRASILKLPRLFGVGADQDFVYLMEPSPDEKLLVCAHMSGRVSVWSLPALLPLHQFTPEEQACYDDVSPQVLQQAGRNKTAFLQNSFPWHPVQIRWWDQDKIVVARYSGGLTMWSIRDSTTNLLGASAEFFSPGAFISRRTETGFFVLECESHVKNPDDDDEDHDDDDEGVIARAKSLIASAWNSQKNAPENLPVLKKDFRLLYFQSTTPEELYQAKIDSEEYGEAIILARHYSLDCDLVYERQWLLSNHSKAAILDYLGKVKNRTVVLRECLVTLPDSLEATEALFKFGLNTVKKARSDENEDGFTEEELDTCERRLSEYMSRLHTYEAILFDQVEKEKTHFDPGIFRHFRQRSLLESAMAYAEEADVCAVMTMLDKHWNVVEDSDQEEGGLEEHFFDILSSFPESLSPSRYARILPPFKQSHGDNGVEGMTTWYEQRARQMVSESGLPERALELLKFGLDSRLGIDQQLHHNLASLVTVLYESQHSFLTLGQVEAMSDHALLEELLRHSTETTIMGDFRRLCVPFLERVETVRRGSSPGVLKACLLQLVDSHFAAILSLLKAGKEERAFDHFLSNDDFFNICIDIFYHANEETEFEHFLKFAKSLTRWFAEGTESQRKKLANINACINTMKILKKYKVPVTVGVLNEATTNEDEANRLVGAFLKNAIGPNTRVRDVSDHIIPDLLDLQHSCAAVQATKCLQRLCRRLLQTGNEDHIKLVREVFRPTPTSDPCAVSLLNAVGRTKVADIDANELAMAAFDHFFFAARDCIDPNLILAKLCLSLARPDHRRSRKLESLLLAVDVLAGFDRPTIPQALKQLDAVHKIVSFLEKIVRVRTFNLKLKDKVLSFARHLAAANSLDEADAATLEGRLLSSMARMCTDDGDKESAYVLCAEIMRSGYSVGWQACFALVSCAETDNEKDRARMLDLLAFCAVHADSELIARVVELEERLEAEGNGKGRVQVQLDEDGMLPDYLVFYEKVRGEKRAASSKPKEAEEPKRKKKHVAQKTKAEAKENREEQAPSPFPLDDEEAKAEKGKEEEDPVAARFLQQVIHGVPASLRTLASNL